MTTEESANASKENRAQELRKLRGPFNKLIAQAMRRDGIGEVTKWADHWKIGRTTIYTLLRGRETKTGGWVKPSIDTLVTLSHALRVPTHELLYMLEPEAPGAESVAALETRNSELVMVPVAGIVGGGPEQFEELEGCAVGVEPKFARGKDLVAFRVRGDSMAAGKHPIHDGDQILVNRHDKGHNTNSVVARLVSDGYVCKMLKDDKFGRLLQSRNPEHTNGSPTLIPADLVAEIVGRVVRIIHDEPNSAA